MIRVNKEQFEAVCKEICQENWYKKEDYLSIKRDKIITHYLRPPLEKIALNYFPHIVAGSRLAFPSDIVVKIASKMNLYVTDIVRYKLK